jgi:ribonucleotide monophosphatase NagD (HAD superfamily)
LAKEYERLGGSAVYYGKPHLPIYDEAKRAIGPAKKPLAVGDGLNTDILGANRAGLDVLFIADGVHGDEVEPYNPQHLTGLFQKAGVSALAACRSLKW